ncbi:hypothetical protein M8J76_000614 [Diaphorina citri]|nr:hypothetical protein M8J76_000614 [Diaphorina citri]
MLAEKQCFNTLSNVEMVKVHEEDTLADQGAESGPSPPGGAPVTMPAPAPAPARHRFNATNNNNNNSCHVHNNNNHNHQVVHNTKVTNNVATQHFHYHWSYPSQGAPLPPNSSPATFHFGQGFEPQTSPQQHVVHFHVNPGVTVSFQMGDNVQVIKDGHKCGNEIEETVLPCSKSFSETMVITSLGEMSLIISLSFIHFDNFEFYSSSS